MNRRRMRAMQMKTSQSECKDDYDVLQNCNGTASILVKFAGLKHLQTIAKCVETSDGNG